MSIMSNFTCALVCRNVCFVLLFVASTAPALAQDPAYVGMWALTETLCKKPPGTQDAPTVIGLQRYDQFETHCEFTSVTPRNDGWRAKAKCMVEGAFLNETLTMSVKGTTLTYRWRKGGRVQIMKRC
jgi:hypothetical protein